MMRISILLTIPPLAVNIHHFHLVLCGMSYQLPNISRRGSSGLFLHTLQVGRYLYIIDADFAGRWKFNRTIRARLG